MFSHQTRIVLKILTFILQPLILNRYLPKTFRSDHLIKRIDSLHISHRDLFGALSPQNFIIHLNVIPLDSNFAVERYLQNGLKFLHLIKITGAKYLTTPPHFWENAPFLAPLMILWETYALV